jgi:hypothetical protein
MGCGKNIVLVSTEVLFTPESSEQTDELYPRVKLESSRSLSEIQREDVINRSSKPRR